MPKKGNMACAASPSMVTLPSVQVDSGEHLAASPVLSEDRIILPGADRYYCLDLAKIKAGKKGSLWTWESQAEVAASPVLVENLLF